MLAVLAVLAVLAAVAVTPALADPSECRGRPDLVGACRTIRGDLQLFDGTPSARLHIAGSRRVLGVASDIDAGNETFVAPKEVRDAASFDARLRGSFDVCPLERARPGRMQSVCIAGAAGLASLPVR